MNDELELEPEILSYREFRNRQTLLDWERRRRAFEAQHGAPPQSRREHFLRPPLRPGRSASPPR